MFDFPLRHLAKRTRVRSSATRHALFGATSATPVRTRATCRSSVAAFGARPSRRAACRESDVPTTTVSAPSTSRKDRRGDCSAFFSASRGRSRARFAGPSDSSTSPAAPRKATRRRQISARRGLPTPAPAISIASPRDVFSLPACDVPRFHYTPQKFRFLIGDFRF